MAPWGAAQHLAERGIEHAQARCLGRVLVMRKAIVATLLLRRKVLVRVPHRVRERAVLCEEQQKNATQLH